MWWVTILYLTFALIAPFQKVHTDINKTPKRKELKPYISSSVLKIVLETKILHWKIKKPHIFEGQIQKKCFFFKKHSSLVVNQPDEIQHVKLQRQKLGVYISSGSISFCLAGKEFGNKIPLSRGWPGLQDCTGNSFKSGNEDAFCMGQESLTLGYYFLKCETTKFTSGVRVSTSIKQAHYYA